MASDDEEEGKNLAELINFLSKEIGRSDGQIRDLCDSFSNTSQQFDTAPKLFFSFSLERKVSPSVESFFASFLSSSIGGGSRRPSRVLQLVAYDKP